MESPETSQMSTQSESLNLESVRTSLEKAKGPNFWRSLDELASKEGFQEFLHREFPRQASEWLDDDGRRNFLKLMGASLALAGLTGCTRQPTEYVMPYVNTPEGLILGKPMFYATAFPVQGIANPVLVETHEFRPTKVEGNVDHPASLGAADVPTQASVLGLYDPDRTQSVMYLGEARSNAAFLASFKAMLEKQTPKAGSGLRILTETITSPSLYAQLQGVLKTYPNAKWYQWDPTGHGRRNGSLQAFGQYLNTVYNFSEAEVVFSVDGNFLGNGPGGVRYAKDFAAKRKLIGGRTEMSRFYAIETTPTSTNAKADHRIGIKPSEIAPFLRSLAAALEGGSGAFAGNPKFFSALAADLKAANGKSLVIAGEDQSPEVHALVHYINQTLGNFGKTVMFTDSLEQKPVDQFAEIKSLVAELNSQEVELLLILGGNPVYNAPVELNLKAAVQMAKMRVRLGLYDDETSEVCQWTIPETHSYEAWGDAPAYDGTMSIIQPLIAPLYSGKSAYDILTAFNLDQQIKPAFDVVKAYWQTKRGGADFETWWGHSVHDGFVKGSALPTKTAAAKLAPAMGSTASGSGYEISFHSDPYLLDGRYANNGWLQELPRPISRLSWDNALVMSEKTAKVLGVEDEDRMEISVNGQTVWGSVWRLPGQPDGSIAVTLGYGRQRSGRAGNGAGFDGYVLRTSSNAFSATGATLKKLGQKFKLASAQHHFTIDDDRNTVHAGSLEEYKKNPSFTAEQGETPGKGLTLYPQEWKYEGYAWGMAIDMTSCSGCNACVVACQSENNIPVVGKTQALNSREMHWLRIDRYYKGDADNPETYFQPVACVHCESAPCEVVCPVAATEHDQEGLNNMVYNRCVGTRYCSNNCPYKVRRFNFLLYTDWETESLKLQRNPDVTVRSRGVMEKCTYCTQRINYAKITAEKQERRVADGEIVPACAATCPSDAIAFGDLNDPNSKVSKWKREKLNYSLLGELNTRPRTSHLTDIRNYSPELGGVKKS